MSPEHPGRSRADTVLAVAIASGDTSEQASEKAGVSRATVTRRLADPEFRTQVDDIRRRMVDRSIGKLADGATKAITLLVEQVTDPKISPFIRNMAAGRLLDALGPAIKPAIERLVEEAAGDDRVFDSYDGYRAGALGEPLSPSSPSPSDASSEVVDVEPTETTPDEPETEP